MKVITGLLVMVVLAACSLSNAGPSIRAAYLVQGEGQLPQAELEKYPEILVTNNFEDFKKAARHRIGLWIDKNAFELVEEGWLDKAPQSSYPIVLVGNNYPMIAFGFMLQMCCFIGHIMTSEEEAATESGFSVMERESSDPESALIMIRGFQQQPTVVDILKITNDLLDGKVTPMPSPVFSP